MKFIFVAFIEIFHFSKNVDRSFKWRSVYKLAELFSVDDENISVSSVFMTSSVLLG